MKKRLEKLTLLNTKNEVILGNVDKVNNINYDTNELIITSDFDGQTVGPNQNVTYTFIFNNSVFDRFNLDKIIVENCTKSTFTIINNKTYTLEVIPNTYFSGNLIVSVLANTVIDNNGVGNSEFIHNTQAINTFIKGFIFKDSYKLTFSSNIDEVLTHLNTNDTQIVNVINCTSYDSTNSYMEIVFNSGYVCTDYIPLITKVFSEKYESGSCIKYDTVNNKIYFTVKRNNITGGTVGNTRNLYIYLFKKTDNNINYESFNDPEIIWKYNYKSGILIDSKNVVNITNSTKSDLRHNLNLQTDYNNPLLYSCKNGSCSYYNGYDSDSNIDFINKQLNLYDYKEMLINKTINNTVASNIRLKNEDYLMYQTGSIEYKSDSIGNIVYDTNLRKIVIYTNKDLSNKNLFFILTYSGSLTKDSGFLIYGGDRIVYYNDRIEIQTIYNDSNIGVCMLNFDIVDYN